MSRLLDTLRTSTTQTLRDPEHWQVRMDDYVDHLCAPFLDIVPYTALLAFRTETEERLYLLIEDFEQQRRLAPAAATEAALREYGEPWRAGEAFRDAYVSRTPITSTAAIHGDGTAVCTFATFGASSVCNTLLVQYATLNLAHYGDLIQLALIVGVVAPILVGVWLGGRFQRSSARTVLAVIGCLVLQSPAATTLMASTPTRKHAGIQEPLMQALVWPPLYLTAALISGAFVRHRRRAGFLRRPSHV